MAPDEKSPPGNLVADISEDAVAEALRAVERQEALAATEQKQEEPQAAEIAALQEQIRQKDRLLEMLAQQGREASEQVRQAREWMLRQASDREKQRQRAERERSDLQRFASEKLIEDLLPVFDSLDRALAQQVTEEDPAAQALREGMRMVRQQLSEALEAHGASSIEALGAAFDPALHQAVQVLHTDEHPPNTVVEQLARGFRLHERIVRPALVTVARPSAKPQQAAEPREEGGNEQ